MLQSTPTAFPSIILAFFAFLAINPTFSQSKPNVDSLTAVLNKYPKDDTVKAKLLIALSDALIEVNAKEGIAYSEKALAIVEKFDVPELKADALFTKARHLELTSKYDEALDLTKKALDVYEQLRRTKKIPAVHNLLGRIYFDKQDNDNTKIHYKRALSLSEQIEDMKNKIISLVGFSSLYDALNDFTKSITYAEQALELAERHHYPALASLAVRGLGNTYFKQGNFIKALEYTQKALRIDENLGNARGLMYDYRNLGNIYLKLPEPENALAYLNKALSLAIKMGNKQQEAFSHQLISACYLTMKKYKEAATNIEKSITIHSAIGNTAAANSNLLTLGGIYAESQRMVDAHRCFQEVLDASKKSGNQYVTSSALINIGQIYAKEPDSLLIKMGVNQTERYTKTVAVLTEGLEISTKINSLARIVTALEILSIIHERNKDYTQAYDTYKRYITLKDSLSGDDVKKQITRKEIQYEFDKKETALKYEQQLTAEQLEKQKLLTVQREQALTLNQQTLTLKEQALALSNKEKDLVHLAYLKEQAEKQEKTQELSLSEAREKGKELDLKLKNSELSTKNLELSAQQKQNLYLGVFAVLLLGGLGILSYFYTTLKKQKNIITQQNELNEQTIAILSHDIKEPLLGVKLLLKKLNKDDPFVAQASQSLEGQINSVNGILTNLLKMKKLSLLKKDKNVRANAQSVVNNVTRELSVAIQSKSLTIQNDLTEDVTLPIAPEKLQIIVHNLLQWHLHPRFWRRLVARTTLKTDA
jgi:tetratricopeptide (TPR) repeat protein